MENYFKRYHATLETVTKVVNKYGVAVIPGLLDPEECKTMENGFWELFSNAVDRDDQSTWKNLAKLQPVNGMLYQQFGFGQAQILWDIREKMKIQEIFRKLYREDDLTVSMDALAFSLPPEITNSGWGVSTHENFRGGKIPDNIHIDQSLLENDFNRIQGWVTAKDVKKGDATFAFIPKSHKQHAAFREYKETGGLCDACEKCDSCLAFKNHIEENGKSWYLFTEEDFKFFGEKETRETLVERLEVPAGSLVVWDSRLVHCGSKPQPGREFQSTRMVAYISFYPKAWLSEKEQLFHLGTFQKKVTGGHHFKFRFPTKPRNYGEYHTVLKAFLENLEKNPLPEPVLGPNSKQLLEFNIITPLEEFKEFCKMNKRYPTAKENSQLSAWFSKMKKAAREGKVYEVTLDELFINPEWFRESRPIVKK